MRPALSTGATLLELMVALATLAIVSGMAVAGYGAYRDRADHALVMADLGKMQLALHKYLADNGALPDSLADVNLDALRDPWGNGYRYLKLQDMPGHAGARKDHNLVPINSDFDLYSMGPDGESRPPLTARPSRDDIIRANDGRYFGKAEDY